MTFWAGHLIPALLVAAIKWDFLPLRPAGAVLAAAVEVGGKPVFVEGSLSKVQIGVDTAFSVPSADCWVAFQPKVHPDVCHPRNAPAVDLGGLEFPLAHRFDGLLV